MFHPGRKYPSDAWGGRPEARGSGLRRRTPRRSAKAGRLDLALQGLGDNGHTASLFPGLAAIEETNRPVVAAYVEVVGMWRLTLTPPAIDAARRVAFLVSAPARPMSWRACWRALTTRPSCRRRTSGPRTRAPCGSSTPPRRETAADEMTAMEPLPQQHADRVFRSCPMAWCRNGAPGQRPRHGQGGRLAG